MDCFWYKKISAGKVKKQRQCRQFFEKKFSLNKQQVLTGLESKTFAIPDVVVASRLSAKEIKKILNILKIEMKIESSDFLSKLFTKKNSIFRFYNAW